MMVLVYKLKKWNNTSKMIVQKCWCNAAAAAAT